MSHKLRETQRERKRETVLIYARRVGSTWLLQRMSYNKSPRRSVWILGVCGDTIIIMHAQMKSPILFISL